MPVDAVTLEDDVLGAAHAASTAKRRCRSQYRLLWETGRIDNLLRVAGKNDGPFQGRYFNDSDVYKWLEAASWSLATRPRSRAGAAGRRGDRHRRGRAATGRLPQLLLRARAGRRALDRLRSARDVLRRALFQAAVAHHRATGSTRLLDVATRFADHIDATFGPAEQGKRIGTDGHPEVEMGLVELARETGRATLRRSGAIPRRRPRSRIPGRRLRPLRPGVPPGPPAVPRAGRDRRPRRARRLPQRRRGRPLRRDGRSRAAERLAPALGEHDRAQDVRQRRDRLALLRRGVRRGLRAAERARLHRDLRRHRQRHVELADAADRRATPATPT